MGPYVPSLFVEPEMDAAPLLDLAVRFSSRRLGRSEAEIERALERGESEAHSTLRYSIAKGLAEHLARLGQAVQGIYLYGSTMNGDARPASDIDLIVILTRRLDEASALLRRLDLALVAAYRERLGSEAAPRSLLDVHLLDLDDEADRRGYGAVVHSAETSPVCLWRHTPRVPGAPLAGSPRALPLNARE